MAQRGATGPSREMATANATLHQFLGGRTFSWMNEGQSGALRKQHTSNTTNQHRNEAAPPSQHAPPKPRRVPSPSTSPNVAHVEPSRPTPPTEAAAAIESSTAILPSPTPSEDAQRTESAAVAEVTANVSDIDLQSFQATSANSTEEIFGMDETRPTAFSAPSDSVPPRPGSPTVEELLTTAINAAAEAGAGEISRPEPVLVSESSSVSRPSSRLEGNARKRVAAGDIRNLDKRVRITSANMDPDQRRRSVGEPGSVFSPPPAATNPSGKKRASQ